MDTASASDHKIVREHVTLNRVGATFILNESTFHPSEQVLRSSNLYVQGYVG